MKSAKLNKVPQNEENRDLLKLELSDYAVKKSGIEEEYLPFEFISDQNEDEVHDDKL